MPYQHIEEIGDRSQERFALGLSAQNVIGMVVCGFPLFTISASWPLALRLASVSAALIVGFLATVELAGLPLYAWPLWWVRGRIRMLVQGRSIHPEQLPGVAAQRVAAPLRVGGPLRPARRRIGPRATIPNLRMVTIHPIEHSSVEAPEAASNHVHADL